MASELTECTWCSLLPHDYMYTHCTLTVHQNPTSRSYKETSQNTCRFSQQCLLFWLSAFLLNVHYASYGKYTVSNFLNINSKFFHFVYCSFKDDYRFLQNLQWHFFHNTHFAKVLQMNIFKLIHFIHLAFYLHSRTNNRSLSTHTSILATEVVTLLLYLHKPRLYLPRFETTINIAPCINRTQ
jgi:hypothetical protein